MAKKKQMELARLSFAAHLLVVPLLPHLNVEKVEFFKSLSGPELRPSSVLSSPRMLQGPVSAAGAPGCGETLRDSPL